MSSNGRLTSSELTAIPSGRLEHNAARGWNAGPAKAGLLPLGPQSSYRDYSNQQYFWNLYQSGRGNLAAFPGTSNHGWGKAVDLKAPWMRNWIDAHGAKYGWKKVEAPSEWWHVNYVGGFTGPAYYVYKPRLPGYMSKKELYMAGKLRGHRYARDREAQTGKGAKWRAHDKWCEYWYHEIEKHIAKLKGQSFKRPKRRQVLRNVLGHKFDWKRRKK